MKLVVCGGRIRHPRVTHLQVVADLSNSEATEVIHGGCRGTDQFVATVAHYLRIPVTLVPADWKTHGRAAGPIRNRAMVSMGDLVIAYPGGRGTASTVRLAEKAGKAVWRRFWP